MKTTMKIIIYTKVSVAKTRTLRHIWTRWKKEYLTSLRETHTSNNGSDKETIDVVIVYEDCPRLKWQLTIVKGLVQGHDGFVRSASVQTANGHTNRPITKLYPLEVNVETSTGSNHSGNDRVKRTVNLLVRRILIYTHNQLL